MSPCEVESTKMHRTAMWQRWGLLVILLLAGCAHRASLPGSVPGGTLLPASGPERKEVVRYLALGDSYTIGEGVTAAERWPSQLAAWLRGRGLEAAEPEIVAQTGWTTGDLIAALGERRPAGPFDLVTLLIGVNNQYRGRGLEEYRAEFRALAEQAVELVGGVAARVVVLSIPDWGATPFGLRSGAAGVSEQIDRFNAVNLEVTHAVGARYVDVTTASRELGGSAGYLAADGLHPSGQMYAVWVEVSAPAVLAALAGSLP